MRDLIYSSFLTKTAAPKPAHGWGGCGSNATREVATCRATQIQRPGRGGRRRAQDGEVSPLQCGFCSGENAVHHRNLDSVRQYSENR